MVYSTTTHQIEVPSRIWSEFKQLNEDRDRLNEPIVEQVAAIVDENVADPDEELRAELRWVLSDSMSAHTPTGGVEDGL